MIPRFPVRQIHPQAARDRVVRGVGDAAAPRVGNDVGLALLALQLLPVSRARFFLLRQAT
jgi:hypothetical protein